MAEKVVKFAIFRGALGVRLNPGDCRDLTRPTLLLGREGFCPFFSIAVKGMKGLCVSPLRTRAFTN